MEVFEEQYGWHPRLWCTISGLKCKMIADCSNLSGTGAVKCKRAALTIQANMVCVCVCVRITASLVFCLITLQHKSKTLMFCRGMRQFFSQNVQVLETRLARIMNARVKPLKKKKKRNGQLNFQPYFIRNFSPGHFLMRSLAAKIMLFKNA